MYKVKRPLGITIIEALILIFSGMDILIRINEFISKQNPKPTIIEYGLVNIVFFMIIIMAIIIFKGYTNPKEIEIQGGKNG